MKKFFDLGSVKLTASGEVVGTESALEILSEQDVTLVSGAALSGAFYDPGDMNKGCKNSGDCSETSNNGCFNTSLCAGATNAIKCADLVVA